MEVDRDQDGPQQGHDRDGGNPENNDGEDPGGASCAVPVEPEPDHAAAAEAALEPPPWLRLSLSNLNLSRRLLYPAVLLLIHLQIVSKMCRTHLQVLAEDPTRTKPPST